MWLAVKNQGQKKEEACKSILISKISQVNDVYLPYIHRVFKDKSGKTHRRYELAAKGYMFVNVAVTDTYDSNNKRDIQAIWKQLKSFITPSGYFYWYEQETTDGRIVTVRKTEPIHLLSSNPKTVTPEQLIGHSLIPERAMEYFRNFNEQSLGGPVDAFLVNESFNNMARVNDIVHIVSGPLAGEEGIIVQEYDGNNRKDRRLVARFGNSMTVHYPNIRKYNMVVVREAVSGDKAREPRLWYLIDRMIGILQANGNDNVDKATGNLRALLRNINKLPEKDTEGKMRIINNAIKTGEDAQANENRRLLFLLANIFPPSSNPNFESLLMEYIPDMTIRPFLTPAYNVSPLGKLYKLVVNHKDFEEHIIQVNLEKTFKKPLGADTASAVPPYNKESFIYDAHVAVFDQGNEQKKAVVSWGGFYDKYDSLNENDKKDFIEDLARKDYTHLHSLLSTGFPLGETKHSWKISFDKTERIGGFSITFSSNPDEAISYLISSAAKAAVEMWQGTRLRIWRQLVQRFVLIHNISL